MSKQKLRTLTPEQRARQAELIKEQKPWEKSTGPKTEAGKAGVSQNAYISIDDMTHPQLIRKYGRELRKFHHHKRMLNKIVALLFTKDSATGLPVFMKGSLTISKSS